MLTRTALVFLLISPAAFAQEAASQQLTSITPTSSLEALKTRQLEPVSDGFTQLGFSAPQPAATQTGAGRLVQVQRSASDLTIQRPRNRRSY